MPFDIDCEIRLSVDGEVIVDARRAMLLKKIAQVGSLVRAADDIGISLRDAKRFLEIMSAPAGDVVSFAGRGRAELTDRGRALLDEFETRSRSANSQVKNLWKKPWITADGIVVMGGKVVLVKRGREPFKGMYALPGGIVEYGETAEECVVREMEEETGLRTRVLDLVGVYSRADRDPRGHFITLAFNLTPVGGGLRGGDDAAEAALFPLERLPQLATDHGTILADALRKRDQCRSDIAHCVPTDEKERK
jgi:8-oxo-dGTP diphosphatase